MVFGIPAAPRERPAESSPARVGIETPRLRTRAPSVEAAPAPRPRRAPPESRTLVQQGRSAPRTLSAGSVESRGVTVHRVRLGPKVQKIRVARSAGVQVGDHNRQLNHYRFKIERPRVSLDHLLEGHPARLRSLERLVANPRSWMANWAFRQHLSAGPARPSSRVLFADTSRAATTRISARVDEYGAMVVENSRGVQAADHSIQRNDFNYRLAGQEVSLKRMLHDRPDLVRGLAMTVRYPGNPAVQRSFTRQISNEITRGGEPSLGIMNQDWPGSGLSVEQAAGVQLGTGNTRTDRVSGLRIGRFTLTGWESTAKRIAEEIDEPAPAPRAIDGPGTVRSPAEPPGASPARGISLAPFRRSVPDPGDPGPSISPL